MKVLSNIRWLLSSKLRYVKYFTKVFGRYIFYIYMKYTVYMKHYTMTNIRQMALI